VFFFTHLFHEQGEQFGETDEQRHYKRLNFLAHDKQHCTRNRQCHIGNTYKEEL
jgi:hypothetical protein